MMALFIYCIQVVFILVKRSWGRRDVSGCSLLLLGLICSRRLGGELVMLWGVVFSCVFWVDLWVIIWYDDKMVMNTINNHK